MNDSRTGVIVPARNEQDTVGGVVDALKCALPDALIVVVDDQSTDATACVAERTGALVASTSHHSCGLGNAMNLGIREAIKLGCNTMLTIDADGQYDVADLTRLLQIYRVSGADLVVGNRLSSGRPSAMSRPRYTANWTFSLAFSAALGLGSFVDSQSGMRAFGARAADTCLVTNDYTYTQEQLLRARLGGLNIVSTPVRFYRRRFGASRLVASSAEYARRTVPHLLKVLATDGHRHRSTGSLEARVATH